VVEKKSLKKYGEKRDLKKSSEPKAKVGAKKKQIFVIQKHDASHLHYDFRISIDGVLKSWAVPKGPSTDTKVKRLAIQTEDHPMDYAKFEGVIPEGHYGAGTVMVWDLGTYKNLKDTDMAICFKKGHITIFLIGKKLNGGYALTRFRGEGKQWLLVKMDDEFADARRNPVSSQTTSALTGRTLKEISKEENPKTLG